MDRQTGDYILMLRKPGGTFDFDLPKDQGQDQRPRGLIVKYLRACSAEVWALFSRFIFHKMSHLPADGWS